MPFYPNDRDRDEELAGVVLDGMSPEDQEILRLAFGVGFGPAEIAVTMGASIRRARAGLQRATSRFEERSVAVALTRHDSIDCEVLAGLVADKVTGDAGLSDRDCKLVAEHSASCAVCSEVLANSNDGSSVLDALASAARGRTTPTGLVEPETGPPRRFWETSPVLVALSAVAVVIIGVAALGVNKLIGGHQPVAAAPAASPAAPAPRSSSPAAASPSSSPEPAKTPSQIAAQPLPVVQPVTRTTSPAPVAKPSPPPTAKPSPSSSSSSSSPPASPSPSPTASQ